MTLLKGSRYIGYGVGFTRDGVEVIEKMSEFLTEPIILASIALDTVYQVRVFHPAEKYNERRHHAIKRRTQISSLPGDRPSQR